MSHYEWMKKNHTKVPKNVDKKGSDVNGDDLGGPLDKYTNVTPKKKKSPFDDNFTLLDLKLLTDEVLG